MQNIVSKYVRISDISAYFLCPRLAYFRRRRESTEPSPELVRAAIFKELSRSLASVLTASDPEAAFRSHVEVTCNDAEIVYGLSAEPVLEEAAGLAKDVITGLLAESERMGRGRLLAMLSPCDRAQAIYSDRLHISGHVDRIVMLEGARCPVVVCASRPPENGIYAADRLKLAACGMLMEEKYGTVVERGLVEYVCGWRIRETEIRRGDRMAVLSTRNRIVQAGSAMPDARRGTWCATCQYDRSCNVTVSVLDRFFRAKAD